MTTPSPSAYLQDKTVIVTGGAGFLGRAVVRQLEASGVPSDRIVVPRSRDVDLTEMAATMRLYDSVAQRFGAGNVIVIHLAARVGGIGANRENPGGFFYDNLMMGVQLMEEARRHGVEKFVASAPSAPTRSTRRCRSAKKTSGTATRRRPTRPTASPRRCCWSRPRRTASSTASTAIYLLPVNLYGPRRQLRPATSHVIPALIRKCVEARDGGAPAIVVWGTGTPRANSCTSRTPPRASCSPPRTTTAPSRSTWARHREITIRDLAELIADLTGFRARSAGTPPSPTASRAAAWIPPAPASVRLPRADAVRRRPGADGPVVPGRIDGPGGARPGGVATRHAARSRPTLHRAIEMLPAATPGQLAPDRASVPGRDQS